MNIFGKKSFNEQFLEMLDDLKVSEKERQSMLVLPQQYKETLLQNHLKEKRPSFWSRNTKKKSITLDSDKVNQEFIDLITKLNLSPHEMNAMVGYTLEQRYEYLLQHLERTKSISSLASTVSSEQEPIVPQRTTSMDGTEMTHKYFTEQISNSTTPLKAILRHLQCLYVLLKENSLVTMSFLETEKGIRGLDIVLGRLSFQTSKGYADSVNSDEIKVQVCLILDIVMELEIGCQLVLVFPSLVKQLVLCLALPDEEARHVIVTDKQARKVYLELVAIVCKLLAPVAYRDAQFTDTLITLFKEIQARDGESVIFGNFVSSLTNPVSFSFGIDCKYVVAMDEFHSVWHCRANVMGLINAMILSFPNSKRMFVNAGVRGVLRFLSFQNPPLEFMVQVNEFNQTKAKDVYEGSMDVGESIKRVYLLFEELKLSNANLIGLKMEKLILSLLELSKLLKSGKTDDITAMVTVLEKLGQCMTECVKDSVDKKLWKSEIVETIFDVVGVCESLQGSRSTANKEMLEEMKRLQSLVRILQDGQDREGVLKTMNHELKLGFQEKNLSNSSIASLGNAQQAQPLQPSINVLGTTEPIQQSVETTNHQMPPLPPPVPAKYSTTVILKAPKPTNALQWDKIPDSAVSKSLWNSLFNETYDSPSLDEEGLLKLFEKPELGKTAVAVRESITNTIESASQVHELLDKKLATGVELFASQSGLDASAVKNAILQVDENVLSFTLLERLVSLFPSNNVLSAIKTYSGVKPLGLGELFFKELLTIPRVKERLEFMLFRYTFQREYAELVPDTIIWRSCVQEIRNSLRFRKLLQKVLLIGNYLNGNTFRGNARGFKVSSLYKLQETKTNDMDVPTLVHYLVKQFEHDRSIVKFLEEMPNLEAARRISVEGIKESVQELVNRMEALRNELSQVKQGQDMFNIKLEPFLVKTEKKMQNLQESIKRIDAEQDELIDYFGDDCDSQTLFEQVYRFGKLLESIGKEQVVTDQPRMSLLAMVPPPVDGILKLKPVKGMEPFFKRGTVRSVPKPI